MLSLTLHEPYVNIDSVEQLLDRSNIQPISILRQKDIYSIEVQILFETNFL